MIVNKCSNPDCAAPGSCHEGEDDYSLCQFWLANNSKSKIKKEKPVNNTNKTNISWTGEPFKVSDIAKISLRNFPLYIGIVGKADAGKTTFLAMLYTLLLRGGRFKGYDFAGTKTILGWDELYHNLKVYKNKVSFPDPTPFEYSRLLHFALRDQYSNLRDILLFDTSGEVFSLWAQNREDANAENARMIYSSSNAFILFIDCEDLVKRKNIAKTDIIDIAQMLLHDLRDRPVIVVWSKADRKDEVIPVIKDSLKEELQILFKSYIEIDISNFSEDDPDYKVHVNNFRVIDMVLKETLNSSPMEITVSNEYKDDIFLNYKGR